jgi:tetratricopeptide (TPR) repeat protein
LLHLEEAKRINDKNYYVHYYLGKQFNFLIEDEKLQFEFETFDSHKEKLTRRLGEVYFAKGQFETAADCYQQSVMLIEEHNKQVFENIEKEEMKLKESIEEREKELKKLSESTQTQASVSNIRFPIHIL